MRMKINCSVLQEHNLKQFLLEQDTIDASSFKVVLKTRWFN